MIFQELYGNDNRRPPMTEDAMRVARLRRWDTDTEGPQDVFGQDLSDQYNTQLTADEEAQYQAWAKENHREKDVYDYDLRGAWKELQSGTMTEDERGHLGDKYKKPNHMTFSDQSIYSGQGDIVGGTWSTDQDGKTTYTPGRKLSSVEADKLRRYFIYREPDVKLNLEGKLHQERPLPGITRPLDVFSGFSDSWRAVPSGVLQTASSGITVLKNTLMPMLASAGNEETRHWWKQQQLIAEQNAKDIRAYNKSHFEADPETMGQGTQFIHSLLKTIPKAVGYGYLMGPMAGSLAFGADVGIDETNRLMDEGVDRDTAIWAGLTTFGMESLGLALPAELGATRLRSTLYGATANMATSGAEAAGIKFILEHENYDKIAQQYDLSFTDLAVSGVLGATFGAAFWRSPEAVRAEAYRDAGRKVYNSYFDALRTQGFSYDQARYQAEINTLSVLSLAKVRNVRPGDVMKFAPKIERQSDGTVVLTTTESLNMEGTFHAAASNAQNRLDLLNLSRKFDEQLAQWEKQGGDFEADLGAPSWVLQLFGVNKDKNITTDRAQFVHVLFSKDAIVQIGAEAISGKHGISAEQLRGLAAAIQRPLAVFKSSVPEKHNGQSLVLLTELAENYKGERRPVVVPIRLRQTKRGQTIEINKVLSAYGKYGAKPDWFKAGRLLGVEKTKGLEVVLRLRHEAFKNSSAEQRSVPQVHRSIPSAADSSRSSDGGPTPSTSVANRDQLPDGVIVYENDTAVGDLYQIVGERGAGNVAKDATTKRVRAEQLEREGKSAAEIRKETGWERGADGKWRYEIPDIRLKEKLPEGGGRLEDLVDAPELFAAYPQLRDMRVTFGATGEANGIFLPNQGRVKLSVDLRSNSKELRSVLAHEIQHVIQKIEDFANGGSPDDFQGQGRALYYDTVELREQLYRDPNVIEYQKLTNEQLDLLASDGADSPENAARIESLSARIDELEKTAPVSRMLMLKAQLREKYGMDANVLRAINTAPGYDDPVWRRLDADSQGERDDQYRRLAGEVEARNVQSRIDMTPEERANRTLASTESVPRDEQLLQQAKENQTIRGKFTPRENKITLTPNANLSTFSHEHAHWYSWNLLEVPDAELTPQGTADRDAMLKAMGTDIQKWRGISFEEKRKLLEQFAHWTELYLAQGKVPRPDLAGVFRRFGEWLMNMYRSMVGEDAGANPAAKEVGERFEAQFGEALPPLSPEVRKVLDRMYSVQKKIDTFKPNRLQTLAARIVQAQRLNNQKKAAPIQKSAISAYYRATGTAQQSAATALNTGEHVDVSSALGDAPVNDAMVATAQNAFARSFQMGDTGSIVVLQNRDRTSVASVGQMNAIATTPRYELLSFSRSTGEGAPIVSYGAMPDDRYLGRSDVVDDNGRKIPVTYAVVEAGSVQYSNSFDGTPNPRYGATPDEMQVVAGNGRMAGLSEAYNRGTAENYRTALEEDAALTGIKPEVAKEMQHPVLVRIMSPDFVKTGFIERSNSSNVMAKSALETAVQDSPKVRRNMSNYEFTEDGSPTRGTLQQFLNDIGEPSQLNNLLSADGTPNETAQNRIRAAIFYEAYRDRALTALVADASDKQGVKRILNAMAAFAPHVIKIRQLSNGVLDFGPLLSEVANRIRQAKQNGEPLSSLLDQQGLLAGDNNPAVRLVMEFFIQNQNSTAGLMRVLEPFARGVETTLESMGEGSLLGGADFSNFTLDMAEAMGVFRRMQNRAIDVANAAEGAEPIPRLPDVDVTGMRSELGAIDAARVAQTEPMPAPEPVPETIPTAEPPMPEVPAAEDPQAARITHEQEVFSEEDSGRVMVESLAEIDPEMTYLLEDDDGNVHRVTAQELLDSDQAVDAQADTDMAGIGTAVQCIIRNRGITE